MSESTGGRRRRSQQWQETPVPQMRPEPPEPRPEVPHTRPEAPREKGAPAGSGVDESLPKARRKYSALPIFVVLAAVLLFIVLISPKSPSTQALYTIGSESGLTGEAAQDTGIYGALRISEIMPSNHTAVPDEYGNFPDWVEVWNSGEQPIPMAGVGLSDRGDSIRFLFPEMTLQPGERTVVFCDNTNQAAAGRPLHAKFKLSSVGETVYLYSPNAYLVDAVTYHILGSDTSWALLDSGWMEVAFYSPGYENTFEGNDAYRADSMVTDGALLINEVMADARSGRMDEDGEFSDWVELYNTTDHAVSLDNYALSDKENQPLKWRFPEGAAIAPHGYYLVFCSGKDRNGDPAAVPHASFRISAERDTIVLADSRGRIVDRVLIDNLPEDASWARDANGTFSVHELATPGRSNSDKDGADMDLRRNNILGVYITEVMASNDATAIGDNKDFADWIEIYNASTDIVDLSGCGLSDNIGRPRRWQFPQGTIIQPGEYKVIFCDRKPEKSTASLLHTNFKIKRAGGETVCLSDPQGRVMDKIVLPAIPTDVSYGRGTGTVGFFYYDTATPRTANAADGFRGYAEKPAFTTPGGLCQGMVTTAITIPAGCTVYYTTDGSIPTRDATVYHGETFELKYNVVLRARAYSDTDLRPSEIATATYLINTYHTLPVVSLVCDPDVLWNPTSGMLVTGENVVKVPGKLPFKNTIYREFGKLPQEGHLEYYLQDGTKVLDQGVEFSLMGDYSLDMPQKSFKLRAKALYGAKTFAAPLFDDRPYTEYKSLVLRNSGNDCMFTRLLDGFQSRLLDAYGTQVIHQAWKPVAVYLNGAYWGHMNLRERVDRFFVAQHEGLPLEEAAEMTILEANGALKYGSDAVRKEYKSMIAKIKAGDPAKNPADLQYILDNVDVDNYFEYIALEMFVGNSDIGNTRFYRLNKPGSKWKWIWYDSDYGLFRAGFNSPWSYTKAKGMGDKNIDNTILLKLLTVPEYKAKFLTKLGDIFQTFTTDYMLEVLNPLVELITPEMTQHWARWGEENDTYVISEVPTTVDGAYRYWQKRVERLRNTIRLRPNYLWGFIREAFNLSQQEMVKYFGEQPELPPDAVP